MDKTDALLIDILKQNQALVEQYINKNSRANIDSEQDFNKNTKDNISNRDKSYTNLLEHFVKITRWRNIIKEIHKWLYFWIIMLLTILFSYFVLKFLSIINIDDNNIYSVIKVVSSLISFSSVIIAVPLIITKYLFSNKEDKRIAKIILHTQEHDLNGKRLIQNLKDQEIKKDVTDELELENQNNQMMELVNKTYEKAHDYIFNPSETKEQD